MGAKVVHFWLPRTYHTRAINSVGRVLPLQGRSRRFESAIAHHAPTRSTGKPQEPERVAQ